MDVEKLVEDGARKIALGVVSILDEAPTPEQTAFAEDNWRLYAPAARAVIRLALEAAAGEAHRMYVDCHESNARTGAAMLRNIFQELAASIGGNRE